MTTLACLTFAAGGVWACSVPVFRYALERWPADPYELVVFGRGQSAPVSVPAGANIEIRYVDLAGDMSDRMERLWAAHGDTPPPVLVLRHPQEAGRRSVAWTAAASEANLQALWRSPARREIARRILDGHSIVWVLLAGAEGNDRAEELLRTELAALQRTLQLPEPETAGQSPFTAGDADADLRLELSVLRIDRNDSAEAAFVSMLLSTEPDLADLAGPMAFPIFGRGRVLYALVGAGIEPRNIRQACEYILGSCSCEVKRQNPGADLLMNVDWDAGLTRRFTDELDAPDLLELSAPVAPPSTRPAPGVGPAPARPQPAATAAHPLSWLLPAAPGVLLVAGVILYALLRKPKETP